MSPRFQVLFQKLSEPDIKYVVKFYSFHNNFQILTFLFDIDFGILFSITFKFGLKQFWTAFFLVLSI